MQLFSFQSFVAKCFPFADCSVILQSYKLLYNLKPLNSYGVSLFKRYRIFSVNTKNYLGIQKWKKCPSILLLLWVIKHDIDVNGDTFVIPDSEKAKENETIIITLNSFQCRNMYIIEQILQSTLHVFFFLFLPND